MFTYDKTMGLTISKRKTPFIFLAIAVVLPVKIFTVVNMTELQLSTKAHYRYQNTAGNQLHERGAEDPTVLVSDHIYDSRSTFVIPEKNPIFVAFPKMACSEW